MGKDHSRAGPFHHFFNLLSHLRPVTVHFTERTELFIDLERTFFHTEAALNALILINSERSILVSRDTLGRASSLTDTAAFTRIIVNDEFNHGNADACRTFFVYDMGNVFISEVF